MPVPFDADPLPPLCDRARLMGIVNVTPDSFSDGGRFASTEAAVRQALALADEGAEVIDIGGESTRPGFVPVPAEAEIARIRPVIEALAGRLAVPISIDTTKAAVARTALAAGASWVNDVWGFQADPAMADTVAEFRATAVLMHNRPSRTDSHIDIVDDMERFFHASLDLARRAGIGEDRLILDPGIGFGKTRRQEIEALGAIARLKRFGLPILVGVSRKSFLGALAGTQTEGRRMETLAANLAAFASGASWFRVHDVADHRAALDVFRAIWTREGFAS